MSAAQQRSQQSEMKSFKRAIRSISVMAADSRPTKGGPEAIVVALTSTKAKSASRLRAVARLSPQSMSIENNHLALHLQTHDHGTRADCPRPIKGISLMAS
mmetsp:Transcript_7143/g.16586  ORF Transcript_7143/g.16586 Transcript_7143/m.16586 type:complete len:101 (-) Transcript_7143:236-538(-)